MKDQRTLKILADMFHIASSSLRYWDSEGLIRFERNEENNYRIPTVQTMMDICDVILYRRLSTPIKIMKEIPEMNEDQISNILIQNENNLKKQIEEIQQSIQFIHAKKELLGWFKNLRNEGFKIEQTKLSPIKEFSFHNKKDIHDYINHPYEAAIMINNSNEVQYGLFVDNEKHSMLRDGDLVKKKYLKGLLKVASENQKDNNFKEFAEKAREKNKISGAVIGRYVITVFDEKRYDFYEAWMELLEESDLEKII